MPDFVARFISQGAQCFSNQGRKPKLSIDYIEEHTSIPNVGIRVIISIMRQNVKKIPATMVEG